MCRIRYDLHMSLRENSTCPDAKCDLLGSPFPDGKYYCPAHIAHALKPRPNPHPPPAKVTFGGWRSGDKVGPNSLGYFPAGVLSALYNRLSAEGLTEPDIVSQLTQDVGGRSSPEC